MSHMGQDNGSFLSKLQSLREKSEERLRSYSPYLHYKLTHNLKPLSQFFNLQRLSIPKSFSELKERISNNFFYFNGNYIVVVLVIALLVLLLTNFYMFLAILGFITGFLHLNAAEVQDIEMELGGQRMVLNKRSYYVILTLITVPVVLFTGPIATLLEVVSYSLISIGIHSSLIEGYQNETSFNENVV